MAYTSLGGIPIVMVGGANRFGMPIIEVMNTSLVAGVGVAHICTGQIFWADGGTHTVDTSGSSALGWHQSGAPTFANGGTTVVIGLAAVDAANGPPARAANTTGTITFDVYKSLTGGGGGISTGWNETVPASGTKTIVHGDVLCFAIQMTARGGVDGLSISSEAQITNAAAALPAVTAYNGTSYSNNARIPNVIITASDGTKGYFFGGYVAITGATNQTWNSGSAKVEYGNILEFPGPIRIHGALAGVNPQNSGAANFDIILYSDPLGTPVAERTQSFDANVLAVGNGPFVAALFTSEYDVPANTPVALVVQPTTANNVAMNYKTFNASAHQNSETLGTNCYAVNRATGGGAFGSQNSSKDRFAIGALISAIDDGAGAGPGSCPTSYAHA